MRLLAGLMVSVALLMACGSPAPAAPGGGAAGATAGGSGAAASGAGSGGASAAASDAFRQQVIEGARREGQVNALIQSTWTAEGLRALEQGIEREYGVRLKIHHTPVANYQQRAATLLTELEANVTP